MSWALVLNDAQERALAILKSSAAPSAHATGIRLTTIQSLERLGLVEGQSPIAGVGCGIESGIPVRVTPAGFRAWADILEALIARGP